MARANDYFLAALKNMFDQEGKTQAEISSKSGIAKQTISAYYKGRKNAGLEQQEIIAEACGFSYIEFLARGRDIVSPPPNKKQLPYEYLTAGQVKDMAFEIDNSYTKLYDRVKLWRAAFEQLPVAGLLIKNGDVIYQNEKSREWGNVTGGPLCDKCIDSNCHGVREDCAVRIAINTGSPTTEERRMGDKIYKVSVTPLYQRGDEYFIVSATVIDGGTV